MQSKYVKTHERAKSQLVQIQSYQKRYNDVDLDALHEFQSMQQTKIFKLQLRNAILKNHLKMQANKRSLRQMNPGNLHSGGIGSSIIDSSDDDRLPMGLVEDRGKEEEEEKRVKREWARHGVRLDYEQDLRKKRINDLNFV